MAPGSARNVAIASVMISLAVTPASSHAQASPDAPATLVVFPHLELDSARGIDTVVQLSNSNRSRSATVWCFYVAADAACSPTSFRLEITRGQPLSWRIGDGRSKFPLDDRPGPAGEQNRQSLIPPVPSDPFEGSLWCTVYDFSSERPLPSDDLVGVATIERFDGVELDAASYSAVGIRRVRGRPAGNPMVLGGTFGSFEPCARTLDAVHYLDGALDAPTKSSRVTTRLVILPCNLDFSRPAERRISLQYEVTNELEQRLAVRREQVGCEQPGPLSSIDASRPDRSIFSAAAGGTLTGQTRVYADDGAVGLVAVAIETHSRVDTPESTRTTGFGIGMRAARSDSDVITLPGLATYPPCTADCDNDRRITVDEVQQCVGIALGDLGIAACSRCDSDASLSVSIDEIIGAVNNALKGCR